MSDLFFLLLTFRIISLSGTHNETDLCFLLLTLCMFMVSIALWLVIIVFKYIYFFLDRILGLLTCYRHVMFLNYVVFLLQNFLFA